VESRVGRRATAHAAGRLARANVLPCVRDPGHRVARPASSLTTPAARPVLPRGGRPPSPPRPAPWRRTGGLLPRRGGPRLDVPDRVQSVLAADQPPRRPREGSARRGGVIGRAFGRGARHIPPGELGTPVGAPTIGCTLCTPKRHRSPPVEQLITISTPWFDDMAVAPSSGRATCSLLWLILHVGPHLRDHCDQQGSQR
jgi:hypothetical protein